MPFFSVIIPVYNVQAYLKSCIDSVLNQTYQDFELILVDDGSKDESAAICDAYSKQDSRVRVIHKTNGGVVSARKAGLIQSCGKYITNVDSDDYLAEDYLARFYEIIQQTDASIVSSGLILTTNTGKKIGVMVPVLDQGLYTGRRLKSIYPSLIYDFNKPFHNTGCLPWNLCGKAIERDLIEPIQMMVPDTIKNGEDCAVVIPVVCHATSLYVADYCGYYYRQIGSSMVHAFNSSEAESLGILFKYLQSLELPIPTKNITAFAVRMLWAHTIRVAKALNSTTAFKQHMEQNYGNVISFTVRGMKREKMTVGIRLRMLPMRCRLWKLLWLAYHK